MDNADENNITNETTSALVKYTVPVDDAEPNRKLASGIRDGKNKTLIELRGEGSVILCAPSKGYILHQGNWCNLHTLDEDERKLLIDTAVSFDESRPMRTRL